MILDHQEGRAAAAAAAAGGDDSADDDGSTMASKLQTPPPPQAQMPGVVSSGTPVRRMAVECPHAHVLVVRVCVEAIREFETTHD